MLVLPQRQFSVLYFIYINIQSSCGVPFFLSFKIQRSKNKKSFKIHRVLHDCPGLSVGSLISVSLDCFSKFDSVDRRVLLCATSVMLSIVACPP